MYRLWWLQQIGQAEGVARHAGAHAGAGENAAVIGGAGLAWGGASLDRTGTATIVVVLYSITP